MWFGHFCHIKLFLTVSLQVKVANGKVLWVRGVCLDLLIYNRGEEVRVEAKSPLQLHVTLYSRFKVIQSNQKDRNYVIIITPCPHMLFGNASQFRR